MWLPWPPAILMALLLWCGVWASRRSPDRRVAVARAFAGETALVLALYALWRIAGGCRSEGRSRAGPWPHCLGPRAGPAHAERAALQQVVLAHPLVVQAANLYYAVAHVPAIIAMLLWAFIWHRDRYPRVRNVLALLTGACLLVQLLPVAPPRLCPTSASSTPPTSTASACTAPWAPA